MWLGRPAWAEIDLDAIQHNVAQLKRCVGKRVELLAVVKANAYGHGSVPVAVAALHAGADRLGVACVDEGVRLRRAEIAGPILVLTYVPAWQVQEAVDNDLTLTVNTWQTALAVSGRAAALGIDVPVHLKVDTGLTRFGLLPEEIVEFARRLTTLPNIHIEGLWTHFASSDEVDKTPTLQQLAVFHDAWRALREAGIEIPCRHAANSAATMEIPDAHLDMVRCGIATYGLYPSSDVSRQIELRPAMSLKARVGRVRDLPAGRGVSYGYTYVTDQPTRVALVLFGYADGFNRHFANSGTVLIRGQRAPVIGRVCMDQFVVDVHHIPDVREDDEVVIIGRQGRESITADDLANHLGTINYEVVSLVNQRVPRVYLKGGHIVGVSRLEETLADQ